MWRYRELNAAEKILLARRIPAMAETVRREFKELVEIRPDDADMLRRLVESGLAGSAMSDGALWSANINFGINLSLSDEPVVMESSGIPLDRGSMEQELNGRGEQQLRRRGAVRSLAKSMGGDKVTDGREMESLGRRKRSESFAFFQNLDSTKQWAESQWDRVRVTSFGGVQPAGDGAGALQSPDLIAIDPFWLALANADAEGSSLNEHLLRPIGSRHAALVALAFCGLPLNAGDVKLPIDDKAFAPPHPVALVTKRLVNLEPMQGEASLLVGQRFSAEGDDQSRDPKAEVPVAPSEFVIHRVYRGEVILTNPTPKRRTVDALWQIPAGSLPLAGCQATDSRTLTLEPFVFNESNTRSTFHRQVNSFTTPFRLGAMVVLSLAVPNAHSTSLPPPASLTKNLGPRSQPVVMPLKSTHFLANQTCGKSTSASLPTG